MTDITSQRPEIVDRVMALVWDSMTDEQRDSIESLLDAGEWCVALEFLLSFAGKDPANKQIICEALPLLDEDGIEDLEDEDLPALRDGGSDAS